VHIPPKVAACDIGIKMRPGLVPVRRQTSSTTGMKMATAAVLLMKADSPPITSMMTTVSRASEYPRGANNRRTRKESAPVRSMPAESTSTEATEIVAGWLKPAKASAGVSTPVNSSAIMASSAVISGGSFSRMKL
jgi:hypothetical protein